MIRTPSLALILCLFTGLAHGASVESPDGRFTVDVQVRDFEGATNALVYRIDYEGAPLIVPSRLGIELAGDRSLTDGFASKGGVYADHNSAWEPVYGERSTIPDRYNELTLVLQQESGHRLDVTFRCYNEGVAFSYKFAGRASEKEIHITAEQSEFRFAADHFAWTTDSAQGEYRKVRLSAVGTKAERPMTIQVADDVFAAVGEAKLVNYARMKLAALEGKPGLRSMLDGEVTGLDSLRTPWRVIMAASSPGKLLENNYLFLNLNDPCAIEDTSWIKPGKVIREVTLTTAGGKRCVDFAAAHNLQYVEFDAGWYGPENDNDSDATTITLDPGRSRGPLDLHEVIRYGKERGIGIILYVNRRALETQLDEILPLYQSWGIAGVKYGFVNVGSQEWTAWLHDAVRKAADHQLMVDIHDEYRPTGYSRTYPNLMTQEGIRGDETSPSNDLTLDILFTRMLAGAGDNTICYYDRRVDQNATHAYQLAKAVCFYSPWQFLYWYDRPPAEGERLSNKIIGGEPELEFFDRIPTVWDETRVLHGQIGDYAVIARRSGDEWFVGCMTDATPRKLDLPLDFLDAGQSYSAKFYVDDPEIDTRTHVRINHAELDASSPVQVDLPVRGGVAIHLVPKRTP